MKTKKIAVLFSGAGSNFAYLAKNLKKHNIDIAVALTNNPQAGGITVADKHDIPLEIIDSKTYDSREEFDSEVLARLWGYDFDLVVLAGFMRILTPIFTDQLEAINLHPSLLPRHKGLHAIERSYADEHDEGGVSVHHVSSELDAGEMILQKSIQKSGLSLEQYTQKIKTLEKEALLEAITISL